MNELRRKIAKLARGVYSNEVAYDVLIAAVPDENEDELIEELIDLITHEPQKGGVFGLDEVRHKIYIQRIFKIIDKLEN